MTAFPGSRRVLLVCTLADDGTIDIDRKEQIPVRGNLLDLFESDELGKYFTTEELSGRK